MVLRFRPSIAVFEILINSKSIGIIIGKPRIAINVPLLEAFDAMLDIMVKLAEKPKVAIYWLTACGGCDETIVDLNEAILQVADAVDIVLWPVAMDFKYKNIREMKDRAIALSMIHGSVRNSEAEEMAKLLRRKSGIVLAFGSCACFGGTPGLANFRSKQDIFDWVYRDAPTVVNPKVNMPQAETKLNGYRLTLPEFYVGGRFLADLGDELEAVGGLIPQEEGCQGYMQSGADFLQNHRGDLVDIQDGRNVAGKRLQHQGGVVLFPEEHAVNDRLGPQPQWFGNQGGDDGHNQRCQEDLNSSIDSENIEGKRDDQKIGRANDYGRDRVQQTLADNYSNIQQLVA